MKISNTIAVTFFSLQLLLLVGAEAKTPADHSRLFAQRMAEMVKGLKETHYQGKTVIDPEKGIIRCNCSGLMTHLLRNHFPESYLTVRGSNAPWKVRPLAVTFYETFMVAEDGRKPGWQKVNRMMDSKPGDLIAWRKLSIRQGYNTGHIVMIASKPILEADGRVRVRIVDSSSGKRANDTRPEGITGVGSGDMWFTIDEKGSPVGYWLNEKSKRSKSNKIAIGRIVPITVNGALNPKAVPQIDTAKQSSDEDFVGLTAEAAQKLATKRGLSARVIKAEGVKKPVSRTLNHQRLNFVLKSGKVYRTIRG